MTEIIFIRHGKTENNGFGILQGWKDTPLNQEGMKDAEELAKYLSQIEFDFLISSDLQRAHDCALKIAKKTNKPIIKDSSLRERFFGQHQGIKITDIGYKDASYPEMCKHFYECDCPGGETHQDLNGRLEEFLKSLLKKYPNKRIVVTSHGGVIMLLLNKIFCEKIQIENAKMHKNGQVSYLKFGDDGKVKKSLIAIPVSELVEHLKTFK